VFALALVVALATLPALAAAAAPDPNTLYVNGAWSDRVAGDIVTVGSVSPVIGQTAFASLPAAIRAAADGSVVNVLPGEYGLTADWTWNAAGQPGWYLPIVQNNLTLQGVDADGVPYAAQPDKTSDLPTIYGADYTPNGCWASQSLIAVPGSNVTLSGLALMPKIEVNKTVELVGANPTVKYCRFEPNTKSTLGYDVSNDGGCLYVNGGTVGNGASNIELTDNYFVKSCVAFDSVISDGTIRVARNTFDAPWSYVEGGQTIYGYMIGNTTWSNPPTLTFTKVRIQGNTFINYPTTPGYYLIKNRLNGQFTLEGNYMGGTDNSVLIQVDGSARLCFDGKVRIKSWINDAGQTVRTNILVDHLGVHYRSNKPTTPPGQDKQ
jgi:hypothetical protein